MRRGTGLWGALLVLALASTGCVAAPPPPLQPVDPEFVRTMRPVIQDDLTATLNDQWSLPEKYGEPGWEARLFCDVRIIEVTPMPGDGASRVGVLADCNGFGREGTELVKASFGQVGTWIVELDGNRVRARDGGPDGAERGDWEKRWFTKQALDEIRRVDDSDWSDPAALARRHFGLPADAPLR
ncbi:hypothetical protein [Streptomyces sp. TBY4]|uniref:hypothetical protein n=1 Tax=Streptomyces sp. TBY4 TaxID=2962030 RepID=UPI0020B8F3E1|nr:hypothetical protein [Streptomyces sp. TBY4]MCP3758126.1 hypothetical protein [Streptomyces sp. TBY4]